MSRPAGVLDAELMAEVLEAGTVFAGEWRTIKLLHTGGISHVYEVEHTTTGARRALKIVHGAPGADPKFRERFLEEVRRASGIKSEHVADVIACGVDAPSDKPYVVMELLPGSSLAGLMADREVLPPREVLTLLTQLGHALAAAHDAGVVHRDLKPEGIILAESRAAGVRHRLEVQFVGAGKIASEALQNTTAPMSRPLWMAPEQSETNAATSPATDVWTLGLLAFWMLTGRHYWKTGRDMGSAMMTLMREVVFEPLVAASFRAEEVGVAGRLPPGFDGWFERCVVREPDKRFAHAREALAALSPILEAASPPEPQEAFDAAKTTSAPAVPVDPALPVYRASPPRRAPTSHAPPPLGDLAPPLVPAPKRPWKLVGIIAAVAVLLGVLGLGGYAAYEASVEKAKKERSAKAEKEREAERDAERTEEKKKREALRNWTDEESPIPISAKDPMWGRREAPVTIVVFTDLECPFCKRLEGTLELLKAKYGAEKLRLVYKHNPLPFHKNARSAHEIAEALFRAQGSEAYLKFKDKAFQHQDQLGGDEPLEWAKGLGLTRSALEKERAAAGEKVDADLAAGKTVGVKGTPASFINGVHLGGAVPQAKFEEIIDKELEEAKAAIASGTSPDKVYVVRSKHNRETAPPADPDKDKDDTTVWSVPIGDSPVQGPSAAKVTIVVFSEFECPFCKKVTPTLHDLRRDLGGRFRLVWKDNPLPHHKRAEDLAQFAREVRAQKGDAAFWAAHDGLFGGQLVPDDDGLKILATALGADPAKTLKAVADQKHKAKIREDQALAVDLEAKGTPTFFVNGRRLIGAQPYEKFKEAIEREEALADVLMAEKGIGPGDVYDEIVRTGKRPELERKEPGPIPASSPRRGAKSPKVVVQWFGDLECPYCAKVAPTVDELLREYPDRVQVVWRHLPLPMHKNARLAAMAAEDVRVQAGDEAFFKFASGVFDRKTTRGLDKQTLEALAVDVSVAQKKPLSLVTFRASLEKGKHEQRIKDDEREAERLGIRATPGFLVGRYYVSGNVPYATLKRAVDRALSDAP